MVAAPAGWRAVYRFEDDDEDEKCFVMVPVIALAREGAEMFACVADSHGRIVPASSLGGFLRLLAPGFEFNGKRAVESQRVS
jgi:hypothetical protein